MNNSFVDGLIDIFVISAMAAGILLAIIIRDITKKNYNPIAIK